MNRETLDGLALSQRQGFLGFGKLFLHEKHSFIYNIYYHYVLVLVLYGRSKLIIVHLIYHVYYRHVTTAANKQISLLKIDSPQIFKILSWEIACFSNSACAKEQFNHRRQTRSTFLRLSRSQKQSTMAFGKLYLDQLLRNLPSHSSPKFQHKITDVHIYHLKISMPVAFTDFCLVKLTRAKARRVIENLKNLILFF